MNTRSLEKLELVVTPQRRRAAEIGLILLVVWAVTVLVATVLGGLALALGSPNFTWLVMFQVVVVASGVALAVLGVAELMFRIASRTWPDHVLSLSLHHLDRDGQRIALEDIRRVEPTGLTVHLDGETVELTAWLQCDEADVTRFRTTLRRRMRRLAEAQPRPEALRQLDSLVRRSDRIVEPGRIA